VGQGLQQPLRGVMQGLPTNPIRDYVDNFNPNLPQFGGPGIT
jgi:hypothetical protein